MMNMVGKLIDGIYHYDPIWDGPLEAEEPKHGPTSTYEFIILDFGENGVD